MGKFWFRQDNYGKDRKMYEVEADSREEAEKLMIENDSSDWSAIDLIEEALENGTAKIVEDETYFDCEDSEVYFYKEVTEK